LRAAESGEAGQRFLLANLMWRELDGYRCDGRGRCHSGCHLL
jgi:hypothetical protein